MKVGNRLSIKENFLFWQIAYYFLVEKNYRMMTIAKDQSEIWLENLKDKDFPIVRLKRKDLDWSNWIRRDLELTEINGMRIKKAYFKRNLQLLNIYISPYPPVDDYYDLFQDDSQNEREKLNLQNLLIDGTNLPESIHKLSLLLNIDQWPYPLKDSYEPLEVEALKHQVLQFALHEAKKEKKLLESGKPIFTYIFLAIQIIVFLMMEYIGRGFGGSQNLLVLDLFGAKVNERILAGEWWRFITPVFLHIGFFHLFMNSLALYYLGSSVERIFGTVRFVLIYLFSGFFGTLASFIFNDHIAAGASGAIFGCFGALVYFGLRHPSTFQRMAGMNILGLLAFNLVLGFVLPSIDNAGHIGGLIGGFLAAGIVNVPKQINWKVQLPLFGFTWAVTLFALYFGFHIAN